LPSLGREKRRACGAQWVIVGRPGEKGNGPGPRRIVTFFYLFKNLKKRREMIRSQDVLSEFKKIQIKY
jgi:hypothetical protein